jgi:hypothetical protein
VAATPTPSANGVAKSEPATVLTKILSAPEAQQDRHGMKGQGEKVGKNKEDLE